jgi:hypothetical protein
MESDKTYSTAIKPIVTAERACKGSPADTIPLSLHCIFCGFYGARNS